MKEETETSVNWTLPGMATPPRVLRSSGTLKTIDSPQREQTSVPLP